MIDTSVIFDIITPNVSTIISAFAGWFFARKKYNSEVDNTLIENMQKSLDFYMKLSDDNKTRLDEVLLESLNDRKAVSTVMKENLELKNEVKDLRKQVFDLTMNICLDLSCAHRMRESKKNRKVKEESKELIKGS